MRPTGWTDVGRAKVQNSKENSDFSHRNKLEQKFGIEILDDSTNRKSPRTGYLFNIRPSIEYENPSDGDKLIKRSALSLYFIDENGATFRSTVFFSPYFYIDLYQYINNVYVEDLEHKMVYLCQILKDLASEQCREKVDVNIERKIDLDAPQHIKKVKEGSSSILNQFSTQGDGLFYESAVYQVKPLIKISFTNIEDFRIFRRELENKKEAGKKLIDSFSSINNSTFCEKDNNLMVHLESNPLFYISNLFEADLNLVARACIDKDIRCGLWYHVYYLNNELTLNRCNNEFQSLKPLTKYLAWDIEVTKEPLRFPNSRKDSITLISYMCDSQGFLIVNREFVKEDISDFEYTPKAIYPGHFHIFNVPNEKALLLKFISHIKEINPHVFVTYNGDNFDFEFVRVRCEILDIFLLDEIGFPYSSMDGIPPVIAGLPVTVRTRMGEKQEYQGRIHVHIDCLRWVERDSYLPCGSRGLKAVTRSKLGYEPRELDPELMMQYAEEYPYALAEYSVSDAVATYYLYAKFIHNFIFALASIIPLPPDDILRKGAGTLCEHLLMAEAYKENILIPNKHVEILEKWHNNKLLYAETYSGGSVAQLLSGVYRSDIPEAFQLDPQQFQSLADCIDKVLDQFFQRGDGQGIKLDIVENLQDVKQDIQKKLLQYRDNPECLERPLIYHYDVGAMYPNIILSNRLQPTSIIKNQITCQECPYYNDRFICQKPMAWLWKGEQFPLMQSQIEFVQDHMKNEVFYIQDNTVKSAKSVPVVKSDSEETTDASADEDAFQDQKKSQTDVKTWSQLTKKQQHEIFFERLKLLSRKQSLKFKVPIEEQRKNIVCMREHSFYVDTVRKFRDRRNIYKGKKRVAEYKLQNCKNEQQRQEAQNQIVLYDSLQLAHKCILNTFYGYVMRKGSRWYSMEMAAIVTYTGSQIIKDAFLMSSAVGKPLELDTDGIWTLLPENFPTDYIFKYTTDDGQKKTKKMNYYCELLNLSINEKWSNKQYLTLNKSSYQFDQTVENSVFFEVDGPYKAMLLPASEKEGQSLKKRYAVFNKANEIVELKGFEIKRRGELPLLKLFQQEIFSQFTKGTTKQEAYAEVAKVANRWLDFIQNHGNAVDNLSELFDLIGETKFLSKAVKNQENYKNLAVTTAKRLTELFGDPSYINDKGVKCQYVVCAKADLEKSMRAVPVKLFEASHEIQKHYLGRWLGLTNINLNATRELFDWDYYKQRLINTILKIIIIPALSQGLNNPVPRVEPPEWIRRAAILNRSTQSRLSYYFGTRIKKSQHNKKNLLPVAEQIEEISLSSEKEVVTEEFTELAIMNDVEMVEKPSVKSFKDWINQEKLQWKTIRDSLILSKKSRTKIEAGLLEIAPHRANKCLIDVHTISNDVLLCYKNQRITNPTWYILNIVPTENGICWFYIRLMDVNNKIYRVQVDHMRRIIINSKSLYNIDNENVLKREIKKEANYILPRKLRRFKLMELYMPKSFYDEFVANPIIDSHVISLYGTSTPELFDLFCSYGIGVRLNCLSKKNFINYNPSFGEYIQGPISFENADISLEDFQNILSWIYVFVFHLEGTKFIVYIHHPPVIEKDKSAYEGTSGFTITYIVDDSEMYINKLKKLNMKKVFINYTKTISGHTPSFMSLPDTEILLKNWIFLSTEIFSTREDMIQKLKSFLSQTSKRLIKDRKPPLGVFLYNCIPPFMLEDIIKPKNTINNNESTYVIFDANEHSSFTDLPKFSSTDFIGYSFRYSIDGLMSYNYLVEWSTQVAYAAQIPVIQTLQWNSTPARLQQTIWDIAFNRALNANSMVSWESDSYDPDFGTKRISPKSLFEYEFPEINKNANFVNPGLYYTISFRINLGKQLPLEAIANLNYLTTEFNDSLMFEFQRDSKNMQFGIKARQTSLNNNVPCSDSDEEILEGGVYGKMFQHTSQVSDRALAVLKTATSYLKNRFMHLSQFMMNSVNEFLIETLYSVSAWLNNYESMLYDPALADAIDLWTSRYLQKLIYHISKASENNITVIKACFNELIVTTNTYNVETAQKFIHVLFDRLQKLTPFTDLRPLEVSPYRGLIIYDHHNTLGYSILKPYGWDNRLTFLGCLPAALNMMILKAIKSLISLPFKSAGISPTDTLTPENIINIEKHASAVLDTQDDKFRLIKSWLTKISDFDIIKEEWLDFCDIADWEAEQRRELTARKQFCEDLIKELSIESNSYNAYMRQIQEIDNLLLLSSEALIERRCWTIPKKPGMIKIENNSKLVPTVKDNNLQQTAAKLLHCTVTLSPFYSKLTEQKREALDEKFYSIVHQSLYAESWSFENLCTDFCINRFLCHNCSLTFSLNATVSLIYSAYDMKPEWECPHCKSQLSVQYVENAIITLLDELIEVAQAQDIICVNCKQIKKNHTLTYCFCGHPFQTRKHGLQFIILFALSKSLVDYFPSSFPWLWDYLDQIYSVDKLCQKISI